MSSCQAAAGDATKSSVSAQQAFDAADKALQGKIEEVSKIKALLKVLNTKREAVAAKYREKLTGLAGEKKKAVEDERDAALGDVDAELAKQNQRMTTALRAATKAKKERDQKYLDKTEAEWAAVSTASDLKNETCRVLTGSEQQRCQGDIDALERKRAALADKLDLLKSSGSDAGISEPINDQQPALPRDAFDEQAQRAKKESQQKPLKSDEPISIQGYPGGMQDPGKPTVDEIRDENGNLPSTFPKTSSH